MDKMKKTKSLIIATLAAIAISMASCKDDDTNNALPDIGITAPLDKSIITSGQDIKIAAFATDDNGKVARMDFYEGTNKIGEDPIAPYEYIWPAVKAGDYTITVNTIDKDGSEMASASITIKVVDPGQ
jgi:chitinase